MLFHKLQNTIALKSLFFCLSSFIALGTAAKPKLPLVFGDHMVLQRNKPVPVWGKAEAGAPVKLIFGKQVKEGVAGADGSFQLFLDAMPANSNGQSLFVISVDTVEYKDVLVGEVWLCSGQSNMEYTMNKSTRYNNAKRSHGLDSAQVHQENNPAIRLFLVNRDLNKPSDRNKGWQRAEYPWVGQFSAAGYYYARELQSRMHVPVGMIAASVSGSAIEPWLPARAAAKSIDTVKTEEPAGKFFTGLIQPLAPYALNGFLWYQGETNCMLDQREEYTQKMMLLIASWRGLWNNSNLPFYYVQIAPFYYSHSKGKDRVQLNERSLAFFRAAQDKVMANTPNTARIITTDLVDNLEDIHPTYKWEIGKRLAWLALDRTYHVRQVSEGPRIDTVSFNNHQARVNYVKPKLGLVVQDSSKITGFELAGADGRFYPATGIVKKEYVLVSSPEVPDPVALRFAWKEDAKPNLFNNVGLPAEPYRTGAGE